MSLSRLAAKCRACPFVDACDHKEMEAYGFLPLPTQQETIIFSEQTETSAQPTVKGYRHIEDFWTNYKILLGSTPDLNIPIRTSCDIHIDVNKLLQTMAREVQFPERLLGGDTL